MIDQLKPKPFHYLDFRVFLNDIFSWKQQLSKGYTQRQLSEDAKMGLGLFTKIIQGKRDLSAKVLVKLSDLFEMEESEFDDLELLVLYNQSQTQQEKLERLKKLMNSRSSQVSVTTLDHRHYLFYSEWHHSAVREVISSGSFQGSFKELGNLIIPPIGARKAKASIELLKELNLIEEVDASRNVFIWKTTSQLITSDTELAKTSVRKFNEDMIDKGKEALDLFGPDIRNISTVTLSIDEENYPLLVNKVRKFRQEVMEMAVSDTKSNKVFQLNTQLFPLTHNISPEEEL